MHRNRLYVQIISSFILIEPVPRHFVGCVAIKGKQFHTLLVNVVC